MTHNTKTLHDSIPALVIVNSFAILINTLAIIYTFIENDDSRSYPVLVESDKSEESTKDVTEDEASQSGIAKEKAEMNIDNMTLGQLYAESSYYNYDILLYSPRFNGDEDALNKYLDEIDDKIDELEDAKSAFGHRMISEGHAEVVDFFPIQEDILNMYRRDEFVANQDNIGMWKEINEYNLHKKVESAREKKYTFQEIVKTKRNLDITKDVVRQIFSDLIGTSVIQSSRGGGKIHNSSCHHVNSMIQPKTLMIDEDWIEKNADNLQPCKICNGDDLVMELITRV